MHFLFLEYETSSFHQVFKHLTDPEKVVLIVSDGLETLQRNKETF